MIDMMLARYSTEAGIKRWRAKAESFALYTLGLTTDNLLCILFSPFCDNGQNLANWLILNRTKLPDEGTVRLVISGDISDRETSGQLEELSGLRFPQIQKLWHDRLIPELHSPDAVSDRRSRLLFVTRIKRKLLLTAVPMKNAPQKS